MAKGSKPKNIIMEVEDGKINRFYSFGLFNLYN